jgi:uncharacterized damage-inducible protein DinB
MSIKESFLAEIGLEAKTTRKLLERIPNDSLAWAPHEKSMTLGRLAMHVAELFGLTKLILTTNELDLATDYKAQTAKSVEQLLEIFDQAVTQAIEGLKNTEDKNLFTAWKMRNGDKVYVDLPKAAAIRSMSINHLIHHRGQLSVYLRLKDIAIPSIYGPSADEQPF